MFKELFENNEEFEKSLELKKAREYLEHTDYIANKIIEYQFLKKELDQDYTEILKKREEAREVIRKYVEMNN